MARGEELVKAQNNSGHKLVVLRFSTQSGLMTSMTIHEGAMGEVLTVLPLVHEVLQTRGLTNPLRD